MIFNTSDIISAWDVKLLVERLCDEGAIIQIERVEND